MGRAFHAFVPPTTIPDVVVVSSSSSSSDDECEVIGYVKPRHERTPEIIDLSNSENEEPASQTIEINEYVLLKNGLLKNNPFSKYPFGCPDYFYKIPLFLLNYTLEI